MTPDATHQPVLFEAIRQTDKPILELGAGNSSTRQIHELCKNHILTIDDNKQWIDNFIYLYCARHEFAWHNTKSLLEFFQEDKTKWGVVLVDLSTWGQRKAAIQKYRLQSDFVIIHDCDYGVASGYFGSLIDGKRYYNEFLNWAEYVPAGFTTPVTLIGSNKLKLGFPIPAIKVNESGNVIATIENPFKK